MLRPVRLADALRARERLAAVPEAERVTTQRVRELWDSAVILTGSDVGPDSAIAELALHREALRLTLAHWLPGATGNAAELWRKAPATTQAPLLTGLQDVAALEKALGDDGPTDLLLLVRNAHLRALSILEADTNVVKNYTRTRVASLGVIVLATTVVAMLGVMALQWVLAPKDLAKGRPYTLSGKLVDCHPEDGECGGSSTKIFFHTTESPSPWYQVDLGENAPSYSSVEVRNRTDSAMWRAIPLVVEVSDDGQNFREVARRTESFVDWEPHFPAQHARYVRLRVTRQSYLHLEAVKVHP